MQLPGCRFQSSRYQGGRPCGHLHGRSSPGRCTCVGFAQPDTDIRLFDDEGVEVADGEVGEICINPLQPHILFNGYFDNPDATANAYRGEWYLTGDVGRKDLETGAFFFVDRKRMLCVSPGATFQPLKSKVSYAGTGGTGRRGLRYCQRRGR